MGDITGEEMAADDFVRRERVRREPAVLRPEVVRFAFEMERKLMENDHKGGWRQCDDHWLILRLKQEVDELASAVQSGSIDIHREAADVANFAMMISENWRSY